MPAHLVESLADLKSFPRRDRNRPLFGINRLWVSKNRKGAAAESFMAFSSSVNLWVKSICRQSSGGVLQCEIGLLAVADGLVGVALRVTRGVFGCVLLRHGLPLRWVASGASIV